jgi:MFS family permease
MIKEFNGFPRSAKLFLISQFLLAGFYTWPFWFGFATERITVSQFGIYLAVGYVIGLLAEIPTGAFADNFGRKRSAVIGALCGMSVPLVVYLGGNFTAYIIAAVVGGLGSAFISGSLESHLYELPGMDKVLYRKIIIQETFFWQAGLIASTALGGIMYSFNHLLPFMIQSLSFLCGAIVIMQIRSTDSTNEKTKNISSTKTHRFKQYTKTNKEGFLHLFSVKRIRPLIVYGCALSVIAWMSIENLNEAAMIHYNISPAGRGLALSITKVLTLLILNVIVLKKVKTDRQKLIYLCIMTISVFGLYSMDIKGLFLVAFLGFNLISSVMDNFVRPIIHDHIENKWRATAMSSYSFVGNSILAGASILIGIGLQNRGIILVQRSLLAIFIIVAIPSLIRYLSKPAQIVTKN